MKKNVTVVILFIVIMLVGVFYFTSYGNRFLKNKEIISAYGDIVQRQAEMDKLIVKYQKENYPMENAKVILNPYELCPLTALIIFTTDDEESVSVYINEKKVTETEKSRDHLIPIYGLYDNYENVVELRTNDQIQKYIIKTKAFEGNKLIVEKTELEKLDNSLYFLSPNFENNAIYDKEGNLVWYILNGYAGDIEFLENGHFYISDPYQGTNGVKINYSSFLEIDFLGKIYNQYVSDYGYHHELVPLKNNRMLILGNDDDSNFLESVIYIMNLKNGEIEMCFDMYDVLSDVDFEWVKKLGIGYDFVINSAQYFDESNKLLISVRGLNSIMMLDMNKKELEWIFGDKSNYSEKFYKYILEPIDNTRFPAGQHSAFITDDGYLYIHNNDFDMIHNKGILLADYTDNYSSFNLYKINLKDKTIQTEWEYSSFGKEFSKVAGYLNILKNNNKLLTYGWSINQSAYTNVENILITDEKYLNAVIEEVDDDDNLLFRATSPDLVYRTYKTTLYSNKIDNFAVKNYNKISDLEVNNSIMLSTFKIKESLKKSLEFSGTVEAYINRIILNKDFDKGDTVDVFLVSKGNKTYKYNYKKSGEKARKSIRVSHAQGDYAVYVKINNTVYDTNKVISFN